MAKHAGPSVFYKVIAGIFVAVGLVMFLVAFFSGHVTPTQYKILVWFLAPITGLVAGAFTGQLLVQESRVGKALVTATGGFGVWFLVFLCTPLPTEVLVTILLYRNGQLMQEPRKVTIEFANDTRIQTAVNGQVTFRLPSHIDQLAAVHVEGEFVEGGSNSPRSIEADQSIRINLSDADPGAGPTVKPTELPDPEAFVALRPDKETVLRPRPSSLPEPARVRLSYENSSDTSLDLYVLDCWAYYSQTEPLWRIWKLPARGQVQDFDSFDNNMTGYFCFGVRKMNTAGAFIPLACEQLFETAHPKLTLTGTYPDIRLSIDKRP